MPKRPAPDSGRQPLASGTGANSKPERHTAEKQRKLHLQARKGRGPVRWRRHHCGSYGGTAIQCPPSTWHMQDRRARKRPGRNSWVGQGSGKKRAKPGKDEDGTAGGGPGGGSTEHLSTFLQVGAVCLLGQQ